MIGTTVPRFVASSEMAWIAALALSVSKIVSISNTSTDPSSNPRICSVYAGAEVVERHGPEAGVRHVGRDRRRPVRRSDGAGDEPPPPVFAFGHQRGFAGDRRAGAVEVVGELAHAVVGLRDRGRRERVRRHDVGTGSEVGVVDAADRVRLGDVEQVVVAVDGAVPRVELGPAVGVLVEPEALDHGAHRAVEDEDPLRRSLAQRADAHAGTASCATLVCTVEGWASGWTSSRRQIE